tara:strand:- start:792 stop:1022 length:231 start_codon:yes stop_codon:yes gene_type:complete
MEKNIYINDTVSLYGGQNGEVNMELEDGTVLTFNAYNLMRDLPSIVRMAFDEVQCEKDHIEDKYKDLANFIKKSTE